MNKPTQAAQVEYLIKNMTKPRFNRASRWIATDDKPTIDSAGITYRILNSRIDIVNLPDSSLVNLMKQIQPYFPEELKPVSWSKLRISDKLAAKLRNWLVLLLVQLEDSLTERYYTTQSKQYLEILRRRFKMNWTDIVTNENAESDQSIDIHFEDIQ